MLKNLAKKLTNNLGLKVLAVLFAIALWIVVVNIDDPVKPAQYTISVTQDNMDYLTSNGKYSETLGGKNTVTFTASAKRSILEKLSNTDFTAVADMEKIEYVEGDGVCRVPITITCSKYNSNTVTISSKQQYLDVTVEDLGNVQKKDICKHGRYGHGWLCTWRCFHRDIESFENFGTVFCYESDQHGSRNDQC